MRRVERVGHEQPGRYGVVEIAGDVGGLQARRGAQQQGPGRGGHAPAGEQRALEVEVLGALLLHDVRVGDGRLEVGLAADAREDLVGIGVERRGEGADAVRDGGLEVGPRVGDDDVVAVGGEQRGPGDADGAGADLGDPHWSSW